MKIGLEETLARVEALSEAAGRAYAAAARRLRPVHFYVALCVAFFFSTSGVIYNVLLTPPPYNQKTKPNGETQYVLVAPGMHSQYSMEGYTSGFLTTMGGVCVVLATRELRRPSPRCGRAAVFALGFCACAGLLLRRFRQKAGFGSLL